LGQFSLTRTNLRQLMPLPRLHPWPFYDTGGEVIYWDDFSDGILRGAQNDDSAWSAGVNNSGVFEGGVTGITTRAPFGAQGGRVLHIRPPYAGGTFQDYNLGILLSDVPSGSGTMPFIGLEAKIGITSTSHYLGMSIERFDSGFATGTTRNKYECRIEYKTPLTYWRQVSDITGSTGGAFNIELSSGSLSNQLLGNQTIPLNIDSPGMVQPQEMNWTPVKLIADLNQLASGSTVNQSKTPAITGLPIGSIRVGNAYQTLPSGSALYQYSIPSGFPSQFITDKYIKFEFHVGNDTNGAWGDFFIADIIITRENGI
jgi:hypothetical protein